MQRRRARGRAGRRAQQHADDAHMLERRARGSRPDRDRRSRARCRPPRARRPTRGGGSCPGPRDRARSGPARARRPRQPHPTIRQRAKLRSRFSRLEGPDRTRAGRPRGCAREDRVARRRALVASSSWSSSRSARYASRRLRCSRTSSITRSSRSATVISASPRARRRALWAVSIWSRSSASSASRASEICARRAQPELLEPGARVVLAEQPDPQDQRDQTTQEHHRERVHCVRVYRRPLHSSLPTEPTRRPREPRRPNRDRRAIVSEPAGHSVSEHY